MILPEMMESHPSTPEEMKQYFEKQRPPVKPKPKEAPKPVETKREGPDLRATLKSVDALNRNIRILITEVSLLEDQGQINEKVRNFQDEDVSALLMEIKNLNKDNTDWLLDLDRPPGLLAQMRGLKEVLDSSKNRSIIKKLYNADSLHDEIEQALQAGDQY